MYFIYALMSNLRL